jgi:DNA-binding transcriptional LysR family regulator
MDLRRLRYFVICAEELHFTRAARRIGIAQPPLSQQIQVLEKEVGTQLFHRLSRGVELTPAGEGFLKDVVSILDAADRAVISAQQIARGERGSIRIGFTSSASLNPFVPAVISEFRARHSLVDVQLNENTTSVSLEQIRGGRIDVAFLRPAGGETDGLRSKVLFDEDMLVAIHVQHPLAQRKSIALKQLENQPFVLYPRVNGRSLYDAIIGACQNAGFSPKIIQEAPQLASTISLVAAGVGVAIVPASMNYLNSPGVTFRSIKGLGPRASLSLVWREGPLSAVLVDFVDIVKKSAVVLVENRRQVGEHRPEADLLNKDPFDR